MSTKKLKLITSSNGLKFKTQKSLSGQGKKKTQKKTLQIKPTNMQKTHKKKINVNSKAKKPLRRIGNVENCTLIWLDAHIDLSQSDFQNSIIRLRRLVNWIETFTEIDPCIDFIKTIKDEKVFLIVSGSLGQRIAPTVEKLTQIYSIYVFCSDKKRHELWVGRYEKIKGVFTLINDLCNSLQLDIQKYNEGLTSISIFCRITRPILDLNELDPSFMYSQLLKEILIDVEHDEHALKHFVDFCHIEYAENVDALSIIQKFEQKYKRSSAIWWYTQPGILYSMLNKALRTQSIEITIKMGFFLQDLHRQIQRLRSQFTQRETFIVYRGQGMGKDEFEKMKQSQGGLLSFNSFLSTSLDRQVALNFAREAKKNPELIPIFFEMEIDPFISSTPFALVNEHSYFKSNEQEVLFSMNTVYRIGDVKEIKEKIWKVSLKLTSDSDQQLKELTECIRQETQCASGWNRLASLMIAMGRFDQAEEFYISALETASEDDWKELAYIHDQLGRIYDEMGKTADALSNYEESLDIKLNHLPSNDPSLVDTYIGIGSVLQSQDDLDGALEHFQFAREIILNLSKPDQLKIATIDNYVGGVLKDNGEFEKALDSYYDALEIRKSHLPELHPSLAIVYNNIGLLYASMNYHEEALSYYEKTYEIERRCLPSNHLSLAITHHNMAMTLECLHRYQEAAEHQQTSVNIMCHVHVHDPDHPQLLQEQADLNRLLAKL